jgi:hypothetical protein
MNNKVLKYCLIAGVVLVWGLIILNVVKGVAPKKDVSVAIQKLAVPVDHALSDSFFLIRDYPDPFLTNYDTLEVSDKAFVIVPKIAAPVISQDSVLRVRVKNMVQLNGVIQSSGNKNRIGVVTVNGVEYVVKTGQQVDSILIRTIKKESIEIVYGRKSYWIKK